MIQFDDFSAVDHHLRQLAADWIKKGDTAMLAFSAGNACDCSKLIAEAQSAIGAAVKRSHDDQAGLRQIETIARNHFRTVRIKQRVEALTALAMDAGTSQADLIGWITAGYAKVESL